LSPLSDNRGGPQPKLIGIQKSWDQVLSRLAKVTISLGFFGATSLWHVLRRLWTGTTPTACVVLYYHAVAREYREQFARQMDILLRCTRPVRADLKSPLAAGQCYSAITFDDGYRSVKENALPELQERRIHSTIFVVSSALGRRPPWLDGNTNGYSMQDELMTPEELWTLPSDLVSIGSHTITHPHLPALSEEDAKRELEGSRKALETTLQREVRLFSFPYGAFNTRLVNCCREAGYERVFTISPTMAFSDPQEYVTGRVLADPTDWDLEFRLKVLGAYRWLPHAIEWKHRILTRLNRGQVSRD